MPDENTGPGNRYTRLLEKIFFNNYKKGARAVGFNRSEFQGAADDLGIKLPLNLGDVVYAARYRTPLPKRVLELQPKGFHWIIEGRGRSKYVFRLVKGSPSIRPNEQLLSIKIPNATPEIIAKYALSDEQALLAVVRYNRLIDLFLGFPTYSLQSHLRTSVKGIGQIEVDEIYVGVDSGGRQYIVPVQAKGGSDTLNAVQTKQDLELCADRFPGLICRSVSAQFMDDRTVALFELGMQEDEVRIVKELHYVLVPADSISQVELAQYGRQL